MCKLVSCGLLFLFFWETIAQSSHCGEPPSLILHNGQIVTVDAQFHIAQSLAISGERIQSVGANEEILKLAGPKTKVIDLQGKMVLPGLIDSHVHAPDASMFEFDHTIPEMKTIADVLDYIRTRADHLEDGRWIMVSQIFVTRLQDQRFPTRFELDKVAPNNPVFFRTGPDGALNSMALRLCGIDKDFQITDGEPGYLERDPATNEPNGILRSCTRLVKNTDAVTNPSDQDRVSRLGQLLYDYNQVGLTSICDRLTTDNGIALYEALLQQDKLTCRVFMSYSLNAQASMEEIEATIQKAAKHPRHEYNNRLWLRGVKIFLDGGMLTGSAYMRQPWGVSSIYSITDPNYRGLLYVEPSKLYRMAKLSLENDLQFTAHSVGDGAVHALIDAYARINDDFGIRGKRPCITHCNFMSVEAIDEMARLGIVADLQPAWLWLDGKTLLKQFGQERTKYFQPYRTLFDQQVIVGGGSDHMQKIGSMRSVNPYNPFLGMWIAVARQPQGASEPLHASQKISRAEAIRLYTINNAYLTFEEKQKGSLESGKLADLIILDRDLLNCPVDDIRDTQVLRTFVGGRQVYPAVEAN
jgi:predicted amidohydrolase YtcJ